MRLWSPPRELITWLSIQVVALPQAISLMSLRYDAQSFQKCSSALMKWEAYVSNQGSSSKKMILFLLAFSNAFCRSRNASGQLEASVSMPNWSLSAKLKLASCSLVVTLSLPVMRNVNLFRTVLLQEKSYLHGVCHRWL